MHLKPMKLALGDLRATAVLGFCAFLIVMLVFA